MMNEGTMKTGDVRETDTLIPENKLRQQKPHSKVFLCGAGVLVCLADTDAGCLLVAADTGAQFGYRFVLIQLLLIPVLYFAQELTVRIADSTGKGITQLVKEHYGFKLGALMCGALCLNCLLALVTEVAGIASVGQLWGLSPRVSLFMTWLLTLMIFAIGKHDYVEMVGLALGSFELFFIVTMVVAGPDMAEVGDQLLQVDKTPGYFRLVGANIGAVIMPWMLFYQQSATAEKCQRGMSPSLFMMRLDTLLGSVITQLIMIAAMVTTAALFSQVGDNRHIKDVVSIHTALAPMLGETTSRFCLSAAIVGGSIVATIVCALACSWSFAELFDTPSSLDLGFQDAKIFYLSLFAFCTAASLLQLIAINDLDVATFVECSNMVFAPFVLFFLFQTAQTLPNHTRLTGVLRTVLAVVFVFVTVCALWGVWYGYKDFIGAK